MTAGRRHDIVYMSCTEGGYEVLSNLLEAGVEVTEIVSLTPEQGDEYGVSGYYSFEELTDDSGIPIWYPEAYSLDEEADHEHFRRLDPDLLIVNGWQRLVPTEILDIPSSGGLGVHGSASGLPRGRGRSPMNWSLLEDLDRFLLSVIRLDEGVDSGHIVGTRKYDVTDHDTIRTMYYKLVMATTDILLGTLGPILEGSFNYEAQEGKPTYYPKRRPEDGTIHWQDSTRDVYNLIRATTRPYPGAVTKFEGTPVQIWEAIPFSTDFGLDADEGEILQVFQTTGEFVVRTADGSLLVRDWEGEGFDPTAGIRFESIEEHDRAYVEDHD